MTENQDVVLYDKRKDIAIITFNRPDALNALNSNVNTRLIELLDRVEKDDEVGVVILTGSGEKAFVAGADIKEMLNMDPISAREHAIRAKGAADKICYLKKCYRGN